jgi:uncharacterized protein (TIGR03118 family)
MARSSTVGGAASRGGFVAAVLALWTSAAAAGAVSVDQVNLVTSDNAAHPASLEDTHLLNAWGVSFSAGSPFWVSANGSGLAVLYGVNPATDAVSKLGLEVSIPGAGNPTGQVFNAGSATGAFNGDVFLFVSEDGTISGWKGALGTNAEVLQIADPANVYKGSALVTMEGHTYLYAANFATGNIDVLKGDAGAPDLPGKFTDPNLPAGYAPFNIQNLGGTLYVTYALQDATRTDDSPGPGHGFVDAFSPDGSFLGRIGSNGTLNSPWGLAIVPASFGAIAGDLLVGNFGDGRINVFDLGTSSFVGQLDGTGGTPLSIDGLWALTLGNGGNAGSVSEVYFSAGPDDERNGLFGVLRPIGTAPEPGTLALVGASLLAALAASRPRRPFENDRRAQELCSGV